MAAICIHARTASRQISCVLTSWTKARPLYVGNGQRRLYQRFTAKKQAKACCKFTYHHSGLSLRASNHSLQGAHGYTCRLRVRQPRPIVILFPDNGRMSAGAANGRVTTYSVPGYALAKGWMD